MKHISENKNKIVKKMVIAINNNNLDEFKYYLELILPSLKMTIKTLLRLKYKDIVDITVEDKSNSDSAVSKKRTKSISDSDIYSEIWIHIIEHAFGTKKIDGTEKTSPWTLSNDYNSLVSIVKKTIPGILRKLQFKQLHKNSFLQKSNFSHEEGIQHNHDGGRGTLIRPDRNNLESALKPENSEENLFGTSQDNQDSLFSAKECYKILLAKATTFHGAFQHEMMDLLRGKAPCEHLKVKQIKEYNSCKKKEQRAKTTLIGWYSELCS